jgi:hypothetical protein
MNKAYAERMKAVKRESRECHAPIVWLRRPVPMSPLSKIMVVGVSSDHQELLADYERRVLEYGRRGTA